MEIIDENGLWIEDQEGAIRISTEELEKRFKPDN